MLQCVNNVNLVQNGWAVVQRGSAAEPYLRRIRGQGERVPAVLGCQLRHRVSATTRTSHGSLAGKRQPFAGERYGLGRALPGRRARGTTPRTSRGA
jgi:hypothetical protein